MKTLKALKITSILQILFCVCCIASVLCFALDDNYKSDLLFGFGMILFVNYIINPIGIVAFIINLIMFFVERKRPENRNLIGKKWVWIFIWPVVTTVLWLASVVLFVQFTGGV